MIAVDANVLIYTCDRSDPQRQQTAIQLVASSTDGVLLWQVACEFVAASRKLSAQRFGVSDAWSRSPNSLVCSAWCFRRKACSSAAQALHVSRGVSFWDAMILGVVLGGWRGDPLFVRI
jgi:predicted nucleic acid-binding protein